MHETSWRHVLKRAQVEEIGKLRKEKYVIWKDAGQIFKYHDERDEIF